MLHLRAIVPADRTDPVCDVLRGCSGVTNLVVLPGAAKIPAGDLVQADMARESANEIIDALRDLGIERDGSMALDEVDLPLSLAARQAEKAAPGYGEDAVVWEELDRRVTGDSILTWAFLAFLTLATMLAMVAALTDSPILVVGAMVLGPEFGAVAAVSYGILRQDLRRVGDAVRTLAIGFTTAITVTYVFALLGRWTGLIEPARVPLERPLTAFVYSPDRWSFIVALLAGAAGVLSLTADRSSALVGVFISVTTVPAAGNLALALALRHGDEVGGSLLQLGINLGGMVIAGTVTMFVQRGVWAVVLRRRGDVRARGHP